MSHQSGILVSDTILTNILKERQNTLFNLQIGSNHEILIKSKITLGNDIKPFVSLKENLSEPGYYLFYPLKPSNIFVTYLPENLVPIKEKMLYASTKNTLLKQLNLSDLITFNIDDKNDLPNDFQEYNTSISTVKSSSQDLMIHSSNSPSSSMNVLFPISKELDQKLLEFKEIIQGKLIISLKNEIFIPLPQEPEDEARYILIKPHPIETQKSYIDYICPDSIKVKQKMTFSVGKGVLINLLNEKGIEISTKPIDQSVMESEENLDSKKIVKDLKFGKPKRPGK